MASARDAQWEESEKSFPGLSLVNRGSKAGLKKPMNPYAP